MSRRTGTILVGLAIGALVVGFATQAIAGGDGTTTGKPSHTITVSSTATVNEKPDEAQVTFEVRSEDPDSSTAFSRNAKDMQAVLDALKAAGVDAKDIQTLNVSLDQRVLDQGKPSERTVFVASNSVQVTVHDLAALGDTIDAAVQAGADAVNDIRFQLADPNIIRTDALTQAVEGARKKADVLAAAAGASVVGVVTISEDSYRSLPFASYGDALRPAALAATPIVPPSTLQASETVTVVWEIG
jgi:uncharacterized protein YggE